MECGAAALAVPRSAAPVEAAGTLLRRVEILWGANSPEPGEPRFGGAAAVECGSAALEPCAVAHRPFMRRAHF